MTEYHLRDGSTTKDPRLARLVEADPRTRSYPVRALMPVKATRARSYTWSIGAILDQGATSSCVGHAVAHRLIARPLVRPEWSGWAVVDDWLAGTITVPVRDAALVGPVE